MDKIKRFIECLVPVTACNLKCEYCYVIQENRRKLEIPKFMYEPEIIGKGLSKERLGGTSYISICGAGETLLPKEMPMIIYEILKQGHYVNVTTNGTVSQRFDEIIDLIPHSLIKRLHFAFSLHYIELIKTNNIEAFIDNVRKVKDIGCSYVIQLNLYDGYIPYIDEIKNFCIENFGALPQIAATRKEQVESTSIKNVEFYTNKDEEEYIKLGKEFKSPLFDYTVSNFMVPRKEFCYAGQWSFILNLATGMAKPCYSEPENQNIFENLNVPIKFKPIGNNCKCTYCMNSSHFMSLGVIPELYTKSYAELRNRQEANWYNKETEGFLSTALFQSNKRYSIIYKCLINFEYRIRKLTERLKTKIKKGIKNEK